MLTPAFEGTPREGQIIFNTTYRSAATDRRYFALTRAAEVSNLNEFELPTVTYRLLVLAHTVGIIFDLPEDAPEEFTALRDFWAWYTSTIVSPDGLMLVTSDPALLLEASHRLEIAYGNVIAPEWQKAYGAAKTPHPAGKQIAHPSTLTAEELADPNSKAPAGRRARRSGKEQRQ